MSYDDIAARYDEFVGVSFIHQVAVPSVLNLCGPGEDVVDVACGQGVLTRELARRYPNAVGVDLSARLVAIAEAQPTGPPDVHYLVDDATRLDSLATASFDGATCCLATTDVDDFAAVCRAVARVLRPGGWFTLAALHPCFEPPRATNGEHDGRTVKLVGSYFSEGRWWPDNADSLLARIGRHHRTLNTYLSTLLEAGFTLEAVDEPRAPDAVVDEAPIYGEVAEVLTTRWRRALLAPGSHRTRRNPGARTSL